MEDDVGWVSHLQQHGFVQLPQMIGREALARANRAIDDDLQHHYDPRRKLEYMHRSWCPRLRRTKVITSLLQTPRVRDAIQQVLPFQRLFGTSLGQIAIRPIHPNEPPEPPDWHIDGVANPHNGIGTRSLQTFTALVGIFLSTTPSKEAGNFTVWPQSLPRMRDWFAEDRRRMRQGRPKIDPGRALQLPTKAGDVVIANYLLGHGTASNISLVERRAVFFRLALPGLFFRRYAHVVDPWRGWSMPSSVTA
ncbi:MAG: phytanoyl-CoA dioxygenase family protein [Myxococcota bacterium]